MHTRHASQELAHAVHLHVLVVALRLCIAITTSLIAHCCVHGDITCTHMPKLSMRAAVDPAAGMQWMRKAGISCCIAMGAA